MRVNLDNGKPRAVSAHTIGRVDGRRKATIVLSNHLGVILERHVRFASTQAEATKAALDALSGRWTWSP